MKRKRIISLVLLVSFTLTSLLIPNPVYARGFIHKFFRMVGKIARALGRTGRFIVKLPHKATRWMGPVLGPIAANIITQNLARDPKIAKLFQKARRAQRAYSTLEEKDKYLADMRQIYHGQANDLRKQADDIRASRQQMLDKLTSGDTTYKDYKNHVLNLEEIAKIYEKAADKFDQAADKMRAEDVARIFSRDLLKKVWGEVKDAVVFEVAKELEKMIDPDVVQRLLSGETDIDTILDALTSAQINKYLGDYEDVDVDELKQRVRDRIKEILEENKQAFKENWQEKVDEIIQNMINKLEEEKKGLPESEEADKPKEKTGGKGCPNGYVWDRKVGGCIQENCNDIEHAHWSYTGYCVCGSSGSISEDPNDPNKECTYPKDYEACPGCVYACVHLDEDCPLEGIGL